MSRQKKLEEAIEQFVAVYLRVSTDEQADSGLGIEAQKVRCTAMAVASGYEEKIRYYIDEGVSGTKSPDKREHCAEMLQDIADGKIKAVIVSGLDRLARKMKYIINLTEDFKNENVAFISCKEKFDTSTPQGQFVLHIFAALAELERGMIVQRTVDALNEKGKIDGEKGGRLPYGYERTFTIDAKTNEAKATGIQVNHNKAEIVRMVYRLRSQRYPMHLIADYCQALAIGPRGGLWYASTIREILKNEDAYRGGKRGDSNINWPVILELQDKVG